MKDHYDFSKAVRRPDFAEKLKNGYTIRIEHEDYDEIIDVSRKIIAKNEGAKSEIAAKELQA